MAELNEENIKKWMLKGLDLYWVLLLSSIAVLPWNILAAIMFTLFAGVSGIAAVLGLFLLGIASILVQLTVVGFVWQWLKNRRWLPSNWFG